MKAGTKEFYEIQTEFERNMATSEFMPNLDLSKVGKGEAVPKGYFYNNGETNRLFHAFIAGYGGGRSVYINNELLEALEVLDNYLPNDYDGWELEHNEAVWKKVRAAIAAAKGE